MSHRNLCETCCFDIEKHTLEYSGCRSTIQFSYTELSISIGFYRMVWPLAQIAFWLFLINSRCRMSDSYCHR